VRASGVLGRIDNLLDRNRLIVILVFTILYFSRTAIMATAKPFWHDEIFTILLSNLPSTSAIWAASLDGVDLSPPLNTWLTRVVHRTIGVGHATTRLPPMLGFWTMSVVVFHIVRKRANATTAVAALFLPCYTAAYRYSYEARGYGLMVGLFAVVLLAWSQAARGHRRRFFLPLLTLALGAAFWTHYYSVVMLTVLASGELVRLLQNRRPDWGVCAATGFALLSATPLRALMAVASRQQTTFWSAPNGSDVGAVYAFIFAPLLEQDFMGTMIAAAICLIGAFVFSRHRVDPSDADRIPAHEIAAGVASLLIPVASLLLGILVTGAFVPRYALPAVVAVAIVLPLVVHRLNRYRGPAEVVLAGVLAGLFAQSVVSVVVNRPVIQNPIAFRTVLLGALRSPGQVAIGSSIHFLEFWYYAPRELKPQLIYLLDPASAVRYRKSDTIDRGYAALARWTTLPVEPYDRFTNVHRNFKAYSDGSGWLLDKIVDDGADVQEIGREHVSQMLVVWLQ
jgi:hypothetical protein